MVVVETVARGSGTYARHEEAECAAEREAHDAREDRLADARLHAGLDLRRCQWDRAGRAWNGGLTARSICTCWSGGWGVMPASVRLGKPVGFMAEGSARRRWERLLTLDSEISDEGLARWAWRLVKQSREPVWYSSHHELLYFYVKFQQPTFVYSLLYDEYGNGQKLLHYKPGSGTYVQSAKPRFGLE